MSNGSSLPGSTLFEVEDTPTCGRGVFALQDIPAGTSLLHTASLPASVVLRNYNREVCAQCFVYERGRNLKTRSVETGHSFCSQECLQAWMEDVGPIAIQAWTAIEDFIKKKSMQGNGSQNGNGNDDHEFHDMNDARPNEEEIRLAWDSVSSTAHFVLEARNGSIRKPHRRALTSVLAIFPNPDYLSFLLSATLSRSRNVLPPTERAAATEWESLLELVPDPTPYATSSCLQTAIQSYLHLLALLPLPLLPHVNAAGFLALAERDSHNSFGIRSLDDGGEEFMGYGVWPVASFFNHSCSPNVGKRRVGRTWDFWTSRRVRKGEELFISYMGGDEVDLDLGERRKRLGETWAFECGCVRCVIEDVGLSKEDEVLEGEDAV
ncbi:25S rRNA (adenine-N(1))-methyltransferase [Venturia nashicola]|uniref:25S rRNA (Adenine-N(1))-methyltransferase n=1 Tax=Venturia nashicola TaxID=86259 RepID=A0A4Z1P0I5_9PEZI|nr:25S rRNA (adenine-N(1))-methyltransferase [Venturia nashicola]TLD30071.1 25S rRNA (adenine-N(1))-methyltransferase [Venturia nashicola]